jgi:hypothetical protein
MNHPTVMITNLPTGKIRMAKSLRKIRSLKTRRSRTQQKKMTKILRARNQRRTNLLTRRRKHPKLLNPPQMPL